MSTPIYAPWPFEDRDGRVEHEESVREHAGGHFPPRAPNYYAALPWALEELSGSTWRHRLTGEPLTIVRLGQDDLGRPIPLSRTAREVAQGLWPFIGWRTDDRFCIDWWVRTDTLLPVHALGWQAVELAHERACQDQIVAWLAEGRPYEGFLRRQKARVRRREAALLQELHRLGLGAARGHLQYVPGQRLQPTLIA